MYKKLIGEPFKLKSQRNYYCLDLNKNIATIHNDEIVFILKFNKKEIIVLNKQKVLFLPSNINMSEFLFLFERIKTK
jgi:hypothetical protein